MRMIKLTFALIASALLAASSAFAGVPAVPTSLPMAK
jgi:hypothetical protein